MPTDPYGRRIAIAIGKASRPFGDDLNQCCETSPREMFAAFEARLATCLRAATMEALAIGYLFLLQRLLEHLPYRTDRGYTDAAGLIANFQADVVAQIETGHIDVRMLALWEGRCSSRQSANVAAPQSRTVTGRPSLSWAA